MQIAGYEIEGQLGQGGMGVVYRARPILGGPPVALKVLETHLEAPRAAARFKREAEVLATLGHPCIARYAGSGIAPGHGAWLALELVQGESMQDQLKRRGPLPQREALRLVGQLAEGLAHAHERGIVHRDVKPGNVVVREDGIPVLVDFGLALDLESGLTRLTQHGAFMGTPGFWAPEQAKGDLERVGPPADVYGLGATLYALLSGRPPVVGSTLVDFFSSGSFRSVKALELGGELGPEVSALCFACLEVDPDERLSMTELAARIAALRVRCSGESVELVPLAPRKARFVLALALGLAGTSLLAAGAVYLNSREATVDPFERARAARDAGDWAAVVSACAEALRAAPQRAEALRLRGVAHAKQEAYREALTDLSDALELSPDDGEALAWRARARRELELWESALSDAERAIALGVELPSARLSAGIAAHWLRERERALAHLTHAVRLNPDDPLAWGYRGVTLLQQKLYSEALKDLTEALRLDADYSVVRLSRGQVHVQLDDPEAALLDFGDALERDPNDRRPLEERAELLIELDRYAEAEADLLRLTQARPEDGWAWGQLAYAQALQGRYEEAYANGKRALELKPTSAATWANFGFVCKGSGRFSEAIEAFRRTLDYSQDYAGAWVELGQLYLLSKRYPEALDALNHALEAFPTRGDLFNARAMAHTYAGDHEAAVRDATQAISLEKPLPPYWLTRAKALEELGRLEESMRDYDAYVLGNPADPMGWQGKAQVLERQGNLLAALKCTEEALARVVSMPQPIAEWVVGIRQQRARILFGLGSDVAVLLETAELLKIAKHPPDVLYLRARALARLGRLEHAIQFAEQASDWERDPEIREEIQASLDEWREALGSAR